MEHLDPYESLGFHCNITLKAFIANLEERLKGTGITPTQHRALAHLVALGPLPQSELADHLGITPASGVRLVDRMERDGWVSRQPDPHDGRIKRVVPTQKAFEIWKEISKVGREILVKAYQGLSAEQIETVKSILTRVRQNLAK